MDKVTVEKSISKENISWKLIDKYFKDNPNNLVVHHLESYNDFFRNGIKRIFHENNPIRFIEREEEGNDSGNHNECQLYLGGKDGSKIYYCAQESWFIGETKFKNKSLELNEEINWYPETLKHGRFGKGLETAPDWAISRSRYWGNPLPIWQNKDKSRQILIDSMAKLEHLTVNPIYKILNTRELNPDYYQDGNVVVFTDSYTKLPLGISATQYRSKTLAEMRRQKIVDINVFADYAQPMLDEILERFQKYKTLGGYYAHVLSLSCRFVEI